jgi:squalene-hopene/tetraprenyl-beta-curcumene cyclase
MSIGLCDAGLFQKDERLRRAVDWVKPLQQFGTQGDWRIYKPSLAPGGWSFEYFNTWYPDVDDTACTVLALTKQDPTFVGSTSIHRAVQWILGMQNLDGGWAAFDHNNDKLFLNKIPFSDMNSLCDPSTADVTGRIIECFGHILSSPYRKVVSEDLLAQMKISAARGISYLKSKQEISGSWWGRWGCNYVYGTSNVLCGLSTFTAGDSQRELQTIVNRAVKWLKAVQNEDGGWGESVESYALPDLAGCGESTPSQTAWGVMALLAHLPPSDEAIRKGVAWLVYAQTEKSQKGATWNEELFTATGFPMCLYLEYSLYPHYFPMMALGRYLKATAEEKEYI